MLQTNLVFKKKFIVFDILYSSFYKSELMQPVPHVGLV